jgi:hypothetical protein
MKTMLLIISIIIFGLYSCEKESTSPTFEGEIIEMSLYNDNGFSNNSPDTFLVSKNNIILKYGKMNRENKWLFKELIDTSSIKISYILGLANAINVNDFKSKYEGDTNIADLSKYIFKFKSTKNTKIIEFKYSETHPNKLINFINQIDSMIYDYKLKNPVE